MSKTRITRSTPDCLLVTVVCGVLAVLSVLSFDQQQISLTCLAHTETQLRPFACQVGALT